MPQLRINVGCGTTPIEGWLNFDNSWSVRLASLPIPLSLLRGSNGNASVKFMKVAREQGIRWADATKRIPLADDSVEVVYSSHMIEHLDRRQANAFLAEAKRVLAPNGIIRIAIPDIGKFAAEYLRTEDADKFVGDTLLASDDADTLRDRLKLLLVGARNHRWMYDGPSMGRLLSRAGFHNAVVLPPGQTLIKEPGPLDLWERHEESAYVEALKPEPARITV